MSNDHERWLSELYRASAQEVPPPSVDEKILAAARARPRPRGHPLLNWGVPLAAAAVVVLAFSLVITLRQEPADLAESSSAEQRAKAAISRDSDKERAAEARSDAATEAKRPAQAQSNAPPPAESASAERARQAPGRSQKLLNEIDSVPKAEESLRVAPAPPPGGRVTASPEPGSVTVEQVPAAPRVAAPVVPPRAAESTGALSQQAKPLEAAKDSVPAPPGAAADSARRAESSGEDALSPERWLERIDKLRKAGRDAEAREALDEFRKRYPNYVLPEALK